MRIFFKRAEDFGCPSCGRRGTAQANFCANCGANFRDDKADTPQANAPASQVKNVAPSTPALPVTPGARSATRKIVLPALGEHGIVGDNLPARLALSAPFPRAETTEEILEIQRLVRAAYYYVLCPEQKAVVLRAPREGEDGVIVAEAGSEKWTFTAREAATGKPTGKLWFAAANYPFAPSRAEQFTRDRQNRTARRAVVHAENEDKPTASVATPAPVARDPAAEAVAKRDRQGDITQPNRPITIWRLITHQKRPAEVAE